MSTPITYPDDLALFLGRDVDPERGALLISLAQSLCEAILAPLPATAAPIVLRVAGRAFTNVDSATQIGMGSAYASLASTGAGGVGGLYLSKSDRADLRRLAGRGGAFSIDPTPPDAGAGLQPWNVNVTYLDGVPTLEDEQPC